MDAMAAKTGISLLVMLFGFLQDGLKKLETKDYPEAIAAFTKVVEHRQADADLRAQALLWRAMAYGKSGKLAKAKTDLAAMLTVSHDETLRTKALATFAELGGDPKDLLPGETPKEAFETTMKLGLAKNAAGFRRRLDGPFGTMQGITEMVFATEGLADVGDEIASLCRDVHSVGAKVGKGKELGLAQGRGTIENGRLLLTVQLSAWGDEWRFTTVLDARKAGGEDATVQALRAAKEVAKAAAEQAAEQAVKAKAAAIAVAAKAVAVDPSAKPAGDDDREARLKQVVTALSLYASMKDGSFPPTLDDLKPTLGDKADLLIYTDPASKKRGPLLYHRVAGVRDVKSAAQTYMIAQPWPTDDVRWVAFADGHVAGVPEEEFLKRASEQGWQEVSAKPLLPEEELKTKVAALVKQLGDAKPAVRKAAYRELKKIRAQAEPILETYRDHPDPEVRLSVRALLKKPKPAVDPNAGMMGGMGGMGGGMMIME